MAIHPKVVEILEAYRQKKAQEEAEWANQRRQSNRDLLAKACEKWPLLRTLLAEGALVFDEDEGVLEGEGLAPIEISDYAAHRGPGVYLRPGEWDEQEGEWMFPAAIEDLGQALEWAREAMEKREGKKATGEPGEYICPLLSAGQGAQHYCVGKACMWWADSPEVGDACSVWVIAELMTTMARWGLGWADK